MILQCPGLGYIKFPYPEIVMCRNCGAELEIWTDEFEVKCSECGYRNPKAASQSCLEWCSRAELCAGREKYDEYMKNKRERSLKCSATSVNRR